MTRERLPTLAFAVLLVLAALPGWKAFAADPSPVIDSTPIDGTPDGSKLAPNMPRSVVTGVDRPVPTCPVCWVFCSAGGPYPTECEGTPTCLQLDGSASVSGPGSPLSFVWTTTCPGATFNGTDGDVRPVLCLDPDACTTTHCIAQLIVTESSFGFTSKCTVDVAVSTPAPTVEAGHGILACLWPPNHKYVCFTRDDFAPRLDDNCSAPVAWRFTGCTSDQPDDADETDPKSPWGGDGHTTRDCIVKPGGDEFCVRTERAGMGPTAFAGRHYAVQVVATDSCGNESAPTVIGSILVPHDMGPRPGDCRRVLRAPSVIPAHARLARDPGGDRTDLQAAGIASSP